MRILSQDGLYDGIIDVPYEQISIEQRKNEIWCGYYPTLSQHCVGKLFAKYSTEEKAQKAMEMLRTAFNNYDWIKRTGNSEETQNALNVVSNEQYKEMTSSCFQFPADEELEV